MQLNVFDEQAEDDSDDLRGRLEDIRIEMEYPFNRPLLNTPLALLYKRKKS